MKKKVIVLKGSGSLDVAGWLHRFGFDVKSVDPSRVSITDMNLHQQDLVVFTGGTDVSPDMYGAHPEPGVMYDVARDVREVKVLDQCRFHAVPVLGICRGSQLLCVMNGGSLVQHSDNHCVHSHRVFTVSGHYFDTNSTHHQIAQPDLDSGNVIGW